MTPDKQHEFATVAQAEVIVTAVLPHWRFERSGVGQDPAVVAPPGELHVPGSSPRTAGRVGVGSRGVVGVVRHREMTQGLLDLKRLYWNLRRFRTGSRKDQRPYGGLVLKLPELGFWEFLKLTPEELREELSASEDTP